MLSVKTGRCLPCCSTAAIGTTTGTSFGMAATAGQLSSCSRTSMPFPSLGSRDLAGFLPPIPGMSTHTCQSSRPRRHLKGTGWIWIPSRLGQLAPMNVF